MKQIKGFIIVLTFIVAILISNDWQGKRELDQVQFEHDYTVQWEASDFSTVSPTTIEWGTIRYLFDNKGSIERGRYLFDTEDSETTAAIINSQIVSAYSIAVGHFVKETRYTSMHHEYSEKMYKLLDEAIDMMDLNSQDPSPYNGENLLITIY